MTMASDPVLAGQRRLGVVLVLVSALSWSFAGLLSKLVHVDVWTASMLRALSAAVFLLAVLVWRERGRAGAVLLRSIRATPASILVGASSMIMLMAAFFHTTVSNVTVIYATAPFIAAGLMWLMASERPDRLTLMASVVALFGVFVVVGGSFGGATLFGDSMALSMTITFVYAAIALRQAKDADTTAVSLATSLACVIAVAPFSVPLSLTGLDIFWLALLGVLSSGIAYLTFMAGARLISPTEAGLLGVVEVPLAVLWALVFLAEYPSLATVFGGLVIVAAVIGHVVLQRPAQQPAQEAA